MTHDQIPVIDEKLKVGSNLFPLWNDEGKARTPVYISTKHYPNTIDLLFWETGGTYVKSNGHYEWIKNFSTFMADDKPAKGTHLHWWTKCLGHFQSENHMTCTTAIVEGWRVADKSS